MSYYPLPSQVAHLLERLHAPARLVAHLTLVHDVACRLVAAVDRAWPSLAYDREAVCMGAAVHDIGKVAHPRELVQPGHAHECAGEALLLQHNIPERWARFGRTHARWEDELEPRLEDMLVAAADTWWRGRREQRLEAALGGRIAAQTGEAEWQVYSTLDDIASALTADADRRLAWQSQHAV